MRLSSHAWNSDTNKIVAQLLNKKYAELSGNVAVLIQISKSTPVDAEKFYQKFGLLQHDRIHKPVSKLAFYQSQFWNWMTRYKYRMAVKSQKVGLSTSVLMEDAQQAFLPPTNPLSTMGYQTVVIGQTFKKAEEHIMDLQKMIKQSREYSPFLIEKPEKYLLKNEVSKATTIYLRNPFNPLRPSQIIGTGSNPGAVWSLKRVKKVHMSDPAAITAVDDSQLYDAAFSRLAITDGFFVIESPPRGQRGQLWEIYKQSKLKTSEDDPEFEQKEYSKFKVIEIPYTHAVEAGVMEESFFIRQRELMGLRFGQYYECEFLNPYNTWYDPELFSLADGIQLGESGV